MAEEIDLERQPGSGFFLSIPQKGARELTIEVSEKCFRRCVVLRAGSRHSPPAKYECRGRSFQSMSDRSEGECVRAFQLDKQLGDLLVEMIDVANNPELTLEARTEAMLVAAGILYGPKGDKRGS
jgi:hypothetical protein